MGTTGRCLAAGLAAVLAVGPLAGCDLDGATAAKAHGAPGVVPSYDPGPKDVALLRALMAARADAVRSGDESAFLATVDPSQTELVHGQRVLFRNLAQLDLASFDYRIDDTSYTVPAAVPGGDPVTHPVVMEDVRLEGTLLHPVSNQLDLTFVRRDGTWLLGAELEPGEEGAFGAPQERPWFGGPIAARHSGRLTVVVDASRSGQLADLESAVRDGIDRDATILGVQPDDRVLVDATSNGQAVGFSTLSDEEAGAVTFGLGQLDLAGDATAYAGAAIKVNPHQVGAAIADTGLLWHELAHYLLQRVDVASPTWLAEGVAAWVQYYPDDFSRLVLPEDLYQRLMAMDHELPTVGLFKTDPEANYLIAQAAVTWLDLNGGPVGILRLMRAYRHDYQGANTDALTPKLLRRVYHVSMRQFLDETWELLGEFGHRG